MNNNTFLENKAISKKDEKTLTKTIGGRILKLRKQHGLTQEGAALKFNTNKATFCRWEKDSRTPAPEMLLKIAKTWGVSVEYLMYGNDRHTDENIVDLNGLTFQQISTIKSTISEFRKVAH